MWTMKPISRVLAVAASVGTACLLTGNALAQAHPVSPLPLAPACTQFIFSGPVEIRSAQQTDLTFSANGATADGPAKISGAGIPAVDGTVKGSITGDDIALTLTSSDPGLLPNAQYSGQVEADGSAAGTVKFVGHEDLGDVDWNTTAKFFCAKGAQNGTTQQTATVRKDSDVYDAPDGKGNRLGPQSYFLPVGRALTAAEPCRDNWCLLNIPDPEVPGGKGWVYAGEGFLDVK
jgi:hypothetical protein